VRAASTRRCVEGRSDADHDRNVELAGYLRHPQSAETVQGDSGSPTPLSKTTSCSLIRIWKEAERVDPSDVAEELRAVWDR
jgi:hypothetical protein